MSAETLCGQLDNSDLHLLLSSHGPAYATAQEQDYVAAQRRSSGVWVWETLPVLPAGRIGCSLVEHDYALYLFGGFDANGTLSNALLKWTPGTAAWEDVSPNGVIRAPYLNSHFAVVYGGKLWVFGSQRSVPLGARELCIAAFEFSTREWTVLEAREPPGSDINDFSAYSHCVYGDALLTATEDGIYAYGFRTGDWRPLYRENGIRGFHGQYHITVHGSDLWLFGWNDDAYSDVHACNSAFEPVVAKINLETRIWTRVLFSGTAPRLRERMQCVRLVDKWVVHGGSTFVSSGMSLAETYVFNMLTRTWSRIDSDYSRGANRAHYGAAAYRDKAIVFCGGRVNWLGRGGTLSTPCYEVEALRLLTNGELEPRNDDEAFLVFSDARRCLPVRPIRRELFDNPRMSDVVLQAEGKEFCAHQVLLAEASPIFEKMFLTNCAEKHQRRVLIKGFCAATVETLLRYVYGCLEEIRSDRLFEVFQAADLYDVEGLRSLCLQRMVAEMTTENLFEFWTLGEYYAAEELMTACIEYARRRAAKVVSSLEFRSLKQKKPIAAFRFIRRLERVVRQQRAFDPRSYASWGLDLGDAFADLDLSQYSTTIRGKIELLTQTIELLATDC